MIINKWASGRRENRCGQELGVEKLLGMVAAGATGSRSADDDGGRGRRWHNDTNLTSTASRQWMAMMMMKIGWLFVRGWVCTACDDSLSSSDSKREGTVKTWIWLRWMIALSPSRQFNTHCMVHLPRLTYWDDALFSSPLYQLRQCSYWYCNHGWYFCLHKNVMWTINTHLQEHSM